MKKAFIAALSALLFTASQANTESAREWRFNVYLDDNKIGHHHFRVEGMGDRQLVTTDAGFNVKFLFINVYRYQHRNREIWRNGCLQTLESQTDDNGTLFRVDAQRRDETLIIESGDERTGVAGCVQSFAYWDPSFLDANKLLNAQTGEYLDVAVRDLGPDQVVVKGETVPARHYRLIARDLTIDLWYSLQNEWLALESGTDGGRLRYRIH